MPLQRRGGGLSSSTVMSDSIQVIVMKFHQLHGAVKVGHTCSDVKYKAGLRRSDTFSGIFCVRRSSACVPWYVLFRRGVIAFLLITLAARCKYAVRSSFPDSKVSASLRARVGLSVR